MKAGIHPDYHYVVFQDTSSGDKFITRSTVETNETIKWEDGNEYPLAKVEISAFTHPFYTGQMKIVDTAGRVERFERRYGERKRKKGAAAEETSEVAEPEQSPREKVRADQAKAKAERAEAKAAEASNDSSDNGSDEAAPAEADSVSDKGASEESGDSPQDDS